MKRKIFMGNYINKTLSQNETQLFSGRNLFKKKAAPRLETASSKVIFTTYQLCVIANVAEKTGVSVLGFLCGSTPLRVMVQSPIVTLGASVVKV